MIKLKEFLNKHVKISIFDITISSILISLYLILSLFSIKITDVMHIGLDFAILAIIGLSLGPIKGVFIAIIADTINMLSITGIGYWLWQYELINIGVVLLSSLFIFMFSISDRKWLIFSIFIMIMVFLSFYLTIFIISFFTQYKKINFFIYVMVMILSLITLGIYIYLFYSYLRLKKVWAKNVITILNLSSLIIVIFSWIAGPYAFIAYMNRMGINHMTIDQYPILMIPRIIKTYIELPIYAFCIYSIHDLIICKLNYKNHYFNKY